MSWNRCCGAIGGVRDTSLTIVELPEPGRRADLLQGQVDLPVAINGDLVRANTQIERHVDMAVEDQDAVVQGTGGLAGGERWPGRNQAEQACGRGVTKRGHFRFLEIRAVGALLSRAHSSLAVLEDLSARLRASALSIDEDISQARLFMGGARGPLV